ncbi:MAG: glycoside hydrolase family 130 protein [Chthoniobacterales bacterium]|nr:glycoside hydrolase family 130 protein [Chthoniobacterales bacterium]
MGVRVRRLSISLGPNPRRVLLRPFIPSLVVKPLANPEPSPRVSAIFSRVMMLRDEEVEEKLNEVIAEFDSRHLNITRIFAERYRQIRPMLPTDRDLPEPRQLLLGSYFINEYSLESTALFNPSIIAAPDQSGAGEGELRFILSLRATGEGHVSSVTFRSGVIKFDGNIEIDPVSPYVRQPRVQPAARYDLAIFRRKLRELGVDYDSSIQATEGLEEKFLMSDLTARIQQLRASDAPPGIKQAAERALLLAQANYTVRFDDGLDISEKVLFPYAPSESNGIEDARFVAFQEEDGSVTYYATYTAYDGNVVIPQLLATRDFQEFSICTLNGPAVRNKGFALFPRKIKGRYVMLGRQDSENIHIMFSDHLHFWHESKVLLRPSEPWEFVQLGNCGSPIETSAGWLVLTHGVGPMRKYCIGAALLDLENPDRVIGRLRQPLLRPESDEREGYVPNVVYSCGGLIHKGNLILPYAVSDSSSKFAIISVEELIGAMV